MHGRTARGAVSRKTAMVLGLTCSLVAVGGVLSFYFKAGTGGSRSATNGQGGTVGGATGGPPDVAIDVGPGGIGKTGRALNELIDPKNPNRIKAHIGWKKLDPLPKGQYTIVEPRAWIYLEDGRTLELRAATGTIRFTADSKQKRPESGRFEEGVLVRVFAPGVRPASVVAAEATRDSEPPGAAEPVLLAFAASINFDTLTNDYSTTDRVMISTEQTEAELAGLHIVYNDLLGRPDLIETTSGFMRFTKATRKEGAAAPVPPSPAPTTPPTPGAAVPPTAAPRTPKIDLYRIDFSDAIDLSTRGQSIVADKLFLWARMIDGKVPETALGSSAPPSAPPAPATPLLPGTAAATPGVGPSSASTAPDLQATGALASAPPPTPARGVQPTTPPSILDRLAGLRAMGSSSPASITPVRDDDILLAWAGPMTVFSLDTPPVELTKEDVAAKFVAQGTTPVRLSDKRGVDGAPGPYAECLTLAYGATTKSAVLDGSTPESVHLVDPKNRRRATVNRFELNLASGVGHVPGPGSLTSAREAGPEAPPLPSGSEAGSESQETTPDRSLTWNESADFEFALGGKTPGEAGIRSLRTASFTGSVAASDGRASIAGDFLRAEFVPTPHRETTFARVVVEGSAVGESWSANAREEFKRLAADRFDVAFKPAPDGKDSEPSILTATGHVTGEQHELRKPAAPPAPPGQPSPAPDQPALQTTTLTSEFLEATLVTRTDGKKKRTDVGEAYAKGKAHFERSDGITADAEELRAQLNSKTADLTGPKVVIARGSSSISGTSMRLDGKENALLVRSGGEISHDQTSDAATPPVSGNRQARSIGHVHITWTRSMSYNDTTGVGTCEGDTVVTQDQDAMHRSSVRAEQVALFMQPAADRAPNPGDPLSRGPAEARLLRAEASGAGGAPDQRARIESREYVADAAAPGGRKLERLTYIEGVKVIADEEHGIFEVPTAGKALVLDHRVPEVVRLSTPTSPSNIPVIPSNNPRGTTLFVWTGWMKLNRGASIVEMQDGIELTHKPLDENQQPIRLTASHVEGHLRPKDPAAAALPGLGGLERDQLVKAIATGSVVVQTVTEDMRLSAGQIEYDVETQMLTASSPPGETQGVEYIDIRRATPVIGKKLIVLLKPDGKHEVAIIEPMPVTVPVK